MKKRSLFKRLLSGFVATALAATICFGDRVFNDLFASADQAPPQTVKFKFYDHEGQPSNCDLTENVRFYVVGAIVPKGSKITATPGNEDKIIAWNAIQIYPKETSLTNSMQHSTISHSVYTHTTVGGGGGQLNLPICCIRPRSIILRATRSPIIRREELRQETPMQVSRTQR